MILWLTNSLEKPLKIYENGKIEYILSHKMHNVNTMQNMDPGNQQNHLDFDFQSFLLNHCEEMFMRKSISNFLKKLPSHFLVFN